MTMMLRKVIIPMRTAGILAPTESEKYKLGRMIIKHNNNNLYFIKHSFKKHLFYNHLYFSYTHTIIFT